MTGDEPAGPAARVGEPPHPARAAIMAAVAASAAVIRPYRAAFPRFIPMPVNLDKSLVKVKCGSIGL
jgi:hypothetical protein